MTDKDEARGDVEWLFSSIFNSDADLVTIVRRFYNYHGLLNFGHKELFVRSVARRINATIPGRVVSHHDVINEKGRLNPQFLAEFLPNEELPYLPVGSVTDFSSTEVLSASACAWASSAVPVSARSRSTFSLRPKFEIYTRRGGTVFVSTYGFQYRDDFLGVTWANAATRAYGQGVSCYPRRDIGGNLMIIQDQFDASNICHFLYDYVPRIIYGAEVLGDDVRTTTFWIGGKKSAYHDLILSHVCQNLDLNLDQFKFGGIRENWIVSGNVYFFSDVTDPLHPLIVGHPETVRLVRELLPLGQRRPSIKKLYISRTDAPIRRVANEGEIVSALEDKGFISLRLADISPLDQIEIVSGAEMIVAPHGMGLTHIIFAHGRKRLLELFHPVHGSDAYYIVSQALGIDYKASQGVAARDSLDYAMPVDNVLKEVSEFL